MDIHFLPNTTQEERKVVLQKMEDEQKAKEERVHNHPMWEEAKSFINSQRPNILKQLHGCRGIINNEN